MLISSSMLMNASALSTEKAVLIVDYLKDNIPIQQRTIYLESDSLTKDYIPVKLQLGEEHTLLFQVKLPVLASLSEKEIATLSAKNIPSIQLSHQPTNLLDRPFPFFLKNQASNHLLDRSIFCLLLLYGFIYLVKQGKDYWQSQKEEPQKEEAISATTIPELTDSEPVSTSAVFSMEEINWLVNLQQTVEQNMPNIHFDVAQLANDLAISSRHLNRRIRLYTGFSTNQYIQETRLTTAKKLLDAQAYKSVKAVAYEIGYKDVKYFGQLYKKRFGRLPSTYFKKPQFHKSVTGR